jgi:hypothetical protein
VGRRRESPSRPDGVVSMARGVKFVVGFVGRCRRRKASWICEREKLIVVPVSVTGEKREHLVFPTGFVKKKKQNRNILCTCPQSDIMFLSPRFALYPTYRSCFKEFRPPTFLRNRYP